MAVLLCNMGALIVILVVITRQARAKAVEEALARKQSQHDTAAVVSAPADGASSAVGDAADSAAAEATAERLASLEAERESAEWETESLHVALGATAEQLDNQRSKLGTIEDHIRRLYEQMEQFKLAARRLLLRQQSTGQQKEQAKQELARLEQQVDTAAQAVREAREESETDNLAFAIVPYEGPNGTRRRPIYVECLADAVVIQPEGIRLTAADFPLVPGPGDPLAAALRQARDYYATRSLETGNVDLGKAYPLLLVRPEGIESYYRARAALKSFGRDFGYELIEQDWKLAFPPSDPLLGRAMQQAIERARRSRPFRERVAASQRLEQGRAIQCRTGGVVAVTGPVGTPGLPGGMPAAATASPDELARAEGFHRTGSYGNGGRYSPGEHGNGPGQGNESGHAGGGAGVGGPAFSSGDGETSGTGAAYPRGSASAGGTAAGSAGIGRAAQRGSGAAGTASGPAGGQQAHGTASPNHAPHAQDGPGLGSPVEGPGQYAARGGQVNGGAPTPGGSLAAGGAGSSAAAGADRGQGLASAASSDAPAQAAFGSAASSGGSSGSGQAGSGQGGSGQGGSGQGGSGRQGGSRGSGQGDWALPGRHAQAVAVSRPVSVMVRADRFELLPEQGRGSRVIPLGPRTETAIDDFVGALRKEMNEWGIAGNGLYWKPVLMLHVAPDGYRRAADLKRLLDGSGIGVRHTKTSPASPSRPSGSSSFVPQHLPRP